jgi:hypothetical protein
MKRILSLFLILQSTICLDQSDCCCGTLKSCCQNIDYPCETPSPAPTPTPTPYISPDYVEKYEQGFICNPEIPKVENYCNVGIGDCAVCMNLAGECQTKVGYFGECGADIAKYGHIAERCQCALQRFQQCLESSIQDTKCCFESNPNQRQCNLARTNCYVECAQSDIDKATVCGPNKCTPQCGTCDVEGDPTGKIECGTTGNGNAQIIIDAPCPCNNYAPLTYHDNYLPCFSNSIYSGNYWPEEENFRPENETYEYEDTEETFEIDRKTIDETLETNIETNKHEKMKSNINIVIYILGIICFIGTIIKLYKNKRKKNNNITTNPILLI